MMQEFESVQRLKDIVIKKREYIEKIQKATEKQISCFEDEVLDNNRYTRNESRKDRYIAEIKSLNEAFDEIYPEAKEQIKILIQEKNAQAASLHQESRALRAATEELRATEERLKRTLKEYLITQRGLLRKKRTQRKTAATYYKTMTKQLDRMSYFFDKKK